jgi:hypothetical protein
MFFGNGLWWPNMAYFVVSIIEINSLDMNSILKIHTCCMQFFNVIFWVCQQGERKYLTDIQGASIFFACMF